MDNGNLVWCQKSMDNGNLVWCHKSMDNGNFIFLWLAAKSPRRRLNASCPSPPRQRGLSRVLGSFRKHRVGPNMFEPTDGYGHGNIGRDTLDEIFADVFQVGNFAFENDFSTFRFIVPFAR
jgi:hypothetical protein